MFYIQFTIPAASIHAQGSSQKFLAREAASDLEKKKVKYFQIGLDTPLHILIYYDSERNTTMPEKLMEDLVLEILFGQSVAAKQEAFKALLTHFVDGGIDSAVDRLLARIVSEDLRACIDANKIKALLKTKFAEELNARMGS